MKIYVYLSPGRPGVTFWEEYTALSFERGSWKVLGTYHIWVLSVLSTVYVLYKASVYKV